jgi:hypothetical protein
VVESQPSKLLVAGSIPVSRSRVLGLEMQVGFQQAAIKVEKQQEFETLKNAIERVFTPSQVERYLKKVKSRGLRVRDLEPILSQRIFEQVDVVLGKSDKTAQSLYQALTISDQAQMREFYLFQVEKVAPDLRFKFKKIYQYY